VTGSDDSYVAIHVHIDCPSAPYTTPQLIMAPARHADSEAHRRPAARSSHRDTSPDVYTNTEADNYPGGEWANPRSAVEEGRVG
jgi:hypothetical protein